MKPAACLLAALGLAVAAPALAATPGNTCFRMRDMQNHTVVDSHTLYVSVRGKQVYRISTSGACLAAKSSSDPLITSTVGGSDMICRPIDLDLKVGGPGGPSPCIVSSIQRLTEAEVAAIPKKLKP